MGIYEAVLAAILEATQHGGFGERGARQMYDTVMSRLACLGRPGADEVFLDHLRDLVRLYDRWRARPR